MEKEKTYKCNLCKKRFKISDLNKIRFKYDTLFFCNLCIQKTDFINIKRDRNLKDFEIMDIEMESSI